jgi:hypothetical protein
MSEPIKVAYSRAEMIENARKWMRDNYPCENTSESANQWMARFGLMVDFITDHFPATKALAAVRPTFGEAVRNDWLDKRKALAAVRFCERCDGQGWYAQDEQNGGPEQVQCEACYGTGKEALAARLQAVR